MADKTVVRNAAYRRGGVALRQRHNERQNLQYANEDIDPARAHLNVHFKRCEGSYTDAFDRMVESGAISTRGLGKDPKIIDELVFDVNTAYFDRHGAGNPCGGYEYARDFFAEAYRLAAAEAGGEEYVLSAVMHADERNRALSEKLGRDVYHYHLHIAYVPVVDKEIRWSKRCKDPALVGTVKEVVKQVSHSKKWPRQKKLDEHGEVVRGPKGGAVLVNAYSLLQDRFFEHMRAAGFTGFERGARGSTAEHLSVMEYKAKQESTRLNTLVAQVAESRQKATELDKTAAAKKKRLAGLSKKLAVTEKAHATLYEVQGMAQKNRKGNMELAPGDWHMALALMREGLESRGRLLSLEQRTAVLERDKGIYMARWQNLDERTRAYQQAERLHPEQTRAALDAVMQHSNTPSPGTSNRQKEHQKEQEL